MASRSVVIPLGLLGPGLCRQEIVVKVGRVITNEVVCFPFGSLRPMKEQKGLYVVVFDESRVRMLLVLDDPQVIRLFGSKFAEGKILRISNFMVAQDKDTRAQGHYVKFEVSTQLTIVKPNSQIHPDGLPTHCFDLVSISEVVTGGASGQGLVDVCGTLVVCYDNGHQEVDGILCREVVVVMEDNGLFEEKDMVTCVLHGACAEAAWVEYSHAPTDGPVVVVVMFAIATAEEDPMLCSHLDATRVYFAPQYPELEEARTALDDRRGEKDDASYLPLLLGPQTIATWTD